MRNIAKKCAVMAIFLSPLGISSNSSYIGSPIQIDVTNPVLPSDKIMVSVPYGLPIDIDKIKRSVFGCSGFGMRVHPIQKVPKKHKGIDLPAKIGTPIKSTSHGRVIKVERKTYGYGISCVVESGPYTLRYAHMKECLVEKGQNISYGDIIGLVGSTGSSTAAHLHYEVHLNNTAVDPLSFILGTP